MTSGVKAAATHNMALRGVAGGKPSPGEQPQYVDRDHEYSDGQMCSPSAREDLVSMLTMCFEPSIAACHPPQQRHGCIHDEDTAQDSPHLQGDGAVAACGKAQHGEGKAQESAADVPHEDARRRPIPY